MVTPQKVRPWHGVSLDHVLSWTQMECVNTWAPQVGSSPDTRWVLIFQTWCMPGDYQLCTETGIHTQYTVSSLLNLQNTGIVVPNSTHCFPKGP